jgi:hypothetical protein
VKLQKNTVIGLVLIGIAVAFVVRREKAKNESGIAAQEASIVSAPSLPVPEVVEQKKVEAPAPVEHPCAPGMGARTKFKNIAEAQDAVLAAIKNKDEKHLAEYASCDFLVGEPESDATSFVAPEKVIKTILSSVGDLEWAGAGENYLTQYNLPALNSRNNEALIFRKDENTNTWYWAGFATYDSNALKQMGQAAYPQMPENQLPPTPDPGEIQFPEPYDYDVDGYTTE